MNVTSLKGCFSCFVLLLFCDQNGWFVCHPLQYVLSVTRYHSRLNFKHVNLAMNLLHVLLHTAAKKVDSQTIEFKHVGLISSKHKPSGYSGRYTSLQHFPFPYSCLFGGLDHTGSHRHTKVEGELNLDTDTELQFLGATLRMNTVPETNIAPED